MQVVFAIIAYKCIIPNRGTTFAYLLGWGILIPLAAGIPFWFVEYLDIYNRFTNLPAATIFTCIFFKCIECMYDCTQPKYIEDSVTNYILYYSSISPFIWDDKTKTIRKITIQEIVSLSLNIFWFFLVSSILVSWMLEVDFQPFPSNVDLTGFEITKDMFRWQHIANAYIHTWILYSIFKVGFEASGLGDNVKGFATYRVFDAPLTKSRSPTEFWTKRWNIMIHRLLKSGIYKPAAKFFSTRIAILITFIVSGVYHDYVWQVMFHNVSSKRDPTTGECVVPKGFKDNHCYEPIFGRVTAFFGIVCIAMFLERPVASMFKGTSLPKLPTFVIAQLLLLPHLPFVHWYGGDWMIGGFFEHLSIAFFRIRRI